METPLSRRLYSSAQCRGLDRIAAAEFGLSGDELMERAGAAALRVLRKRWPAAKRIAIVCGTGNNGGDGFVLACLSRESGFKPSVFLAGDPATLKNEAARAFQKLRDAGISARPASETRWGETDLVIDAVFGTGLAREITGPHAELIRTINASGMPVLALDIPSGLCADTGRPLGIAVKADVTLAFIALKPGLFTADGPDFAGRVEWDGLGVPDAAYERVAFAGELLGIGTELKNLPPRPKNAHKGLYGHVLVVGGSAGMTGAALLCGEAALRSGTGLVSLALPDANAVLIAEKRPELMTRDASDFTVLGEMIAKASVIAIGPGLGDSSWAEAALAAVLKAGKPAVIDADALNLLARTPCRNEDWILTPHPGEAARLLGETAASVQADRFAAASALQSRYGGIIILKGCGTLVCHDAAAPIALCTSGNPGMASGGMGDALTGVIAALIAQGLSPRDAARLGVCAHAAAGDFAAGRNPRGLIATDLTNRLREVLNGNG